MQNASDILVVAGCGDGRVDPETYDVLAFADLLQGLRPGGGVRVLMIGEGLEAAAEEIAGRAGADVTLVDTPGTPSYTAEAYRRVVGDEIRASAPAYVCAAHTSRGWEWAPCVAARLGAACIPAVNGLCGSGDSLCFLRDLYGGKVRGRYASRAATTLLTLQPGVFKFSRTQNGPAGRVTRRHPACPPGRTRLLGTRRAEADMAPITEAPVIVSAGNGIGERENLDLAYGLARMLPKAAVAGTRTLCDRGWLGYDRQVGVTGATVAPALYIALGISGASQHVMGMRASNLVVAVNTDPRAPIFNEADVGIVEDLTRFIPLVLEAYARSQAEGGQPGAAG